MGFRFVYAQEVEKCFCTKKQRVVIHIAEGFKAPQTDLKHSRQLYYTAEGFTAGLLNTADISYNERNQIYIYNQNQVLNLPIG